MSGALRPFRLLMTADAVGGVWTYALDLARVFGERGMQMTLAVLGPSPSPAQAARAHSIPGVRLVDTGLPLDWAATEPAEIERAIRGLSQLARSVDPDLVHLNSPALAADADLGAPVVGACHSCLATWWSAVGEGEMPEDFRWRSRAHWRGLIACDALIAPTAAFAEATARAYDLSPPFVVRNGRRPATVMARRRGPWALTAGRLWDRGKNLVTIDAAARLTKVPIFAAGPLAGGSGERIRFEALPSLGELGPREMRLAMARSRVFVSMSLYEPFGLAVLEAAQAGCALVLSDIPTFRELWDGAAEFVPAHDSEALARAIESLASDARHSRRLGERARRRAARFTADAMADGVLEIYRLLASGLPMTEVEAVA